MNAMKLIARKWNVREARALAVIWAALLTIAVIALLLLQANSIRLINHIEYMKAGRFQRVRALYEEAGKHAQAVLAKANELNKHSEAKVLVSQTDPDYEAAVDLFSRAIELDPRDEFHPDRRSHYEKLAMIHDAAGTEVEQVRQLIRGYISEGDFTNAQVYANAVLSRQPQDAETWRLLAESRLRAKDLASARSAIQKMQDAGGRAEWAHGLNARLAQASGDDAEAARQLQLAVQAAPGDIDIRKHLGAILQDLDRKEEAVQVLEKGMRHGGSRDPEYLHIYGALLTDLGKPRQAADVLEQASELERNSADIYWELAQAYEKSGKPRHATFALEQAFRLNPELRKKALTD